jgi:NAD(P)-dependent dehydrogenase (short-subunit alcohol dehydrogenase family)
MFKPDLLRGQRILVSGGGTGLGREMVTRFLELGASTVYICGRRRGVLEEAAGELGDRFGDRVRAHALDIRDAAAVDRMVQWAWEDGGPLTGLVNNAAGNFISRTEDLSPRGFDAIANIVLHGTFYATHAVGKRWIAGGHPGTVLSIVVTWVWTGSPFVVPSAMAKAGVHVMTQSLAVEWGRYGIRLNAIAPGTFPTKGMLARLAPDGGAGLGGTAANPMGRHGQMHEIQNLAAFLMAPGCEWLTGQTIALDGAGHLANTGSFTQLFGWGDAEWRAAREAIQAQNEMDRAARATESS